MTITLQYVQTTSKYTRGNQQVLQFDYYDAQMTQAKYKTLLSTCMNIIQIIQAYFVTSRAYNKYSHSIIFISALLLCGFVCFFGVTNNYSALG